MNKRVPLFAGFFVLNKGVMNNRQDQDSKTKQTPDNPSVSTANPFENGQKVDQEIQQAEEELQKEQQFKEAQTERD